MTNILIGKPYGVNPDKGVFQIQSPFVQGLTVGPIPNPSWRLSKTLLSKNDFPVRYIPATEITPIGWGTFFKNSQA